MGKYLIRILKQPQKRWGMIVTAAVLVLAFVGSYQYYGDVRYAEEVNPERLWSAVFYSAVKLYAFSATVSPGRATPLCYEIAKWTAPLCTAYWIFQLAESMFRHQIGVLKRFLRRKKEIIVFGYNDKSDVFLKNLVKEKGRERRIILVTERLLEKEQKLAVERSGVLIYQLDSLTEQGTGVLRAYERLHLERAGELALFDENPAWNFTVFTRLLELTSREKKGGAWRRLAGKIICAVWCEDKVMKKVITDAYDEFEGAKPFNLRVFSMAEMAADDLMERLPLFENCLKQAADKTKKREPEAIFEEIPLPHILIAGFGVYGQAVFERAVLTGNLSDRSKVSGYERLRITVMDRDIGRCREFVRERYPGLNKLCRVEYIEGDIRSEYCVKRLLELPKVTYLAVCTSDQLVGISALECLGRRIAAMETERADWDSIPVKAALAVRMKKDNAVVDFCLGERKGVFGKAVSFGTESMLLTYANVMRSVQEEQAREFNYLYVKAGAGVWGETVSETKEELWGRLSFEKKESCRAQVRSLPYFKALLAWLPELPGQKEFLKPEEDADSFLKKLEGYSWLDALAAQEHRRWNGFCYSYGYAGYTADSRKKGKECWIEGGEGLIFGKVHPCLIEDWEEMKRDAYARERIIYDVCSLYVYSQAEFAISRD